MPEFDKRSVSEMIGEFVREIAVLTLVFVPLEAYRGVGWKWYWVGLAVVATIAVAIFIFAVGVSIERRRP